MIKKPTFPTVTPQQFTKPLDELSTALEDAKKPDGSVDVKDLRDAVKGNDLAAHNLEVVLDQFDKKVPASDGKPPEHLNPRAVYPGCAGVVTQYRVDAESLDKGQVSNVMNLLMKVKTEAEGIDSNKDGVVSKEEYSAAVQKSVVGSGAYTNKKILHSIFKEASPEIVAFFKADSAHQTAKALASQRPGVARQIADRAGHHAATPDGAEALKWTYNEILVDKPFQWTPIHEQLDQAAEGAETSLWRFFPFSNVMRQSSHLDDTEVRSMLNVPDNMSLRDFAAAQKDRVVAKAGGDWDGFIAGNDVE